jgi:glycosyltransferase involved in cell wall biosynthesis
MATVVVAPSNVVNFPEGGGHFWVYMQYAQGLRRLGCEVYWLEGFRSRGDEGRDAAALAAFRARMERYGLGDKLILYRGAGPDDCLSLTRAEAEAVFRRADLLLNFHYRTDAALLSRFRRTALIDIDPGLLQFWISAGQVSIKPHDCYFTIGETVGTPRALFPDCALPWVHIRPPVCLECWPYAPDTGGEAFTTVSSWWGGGTPGEESWVTDGKEVSYDNNKRVSFLEFVDLPQRTSQALELALYLSDSDLDVQDRRLLESQGWRVRHSRDVAGTPEEYQGYIQGSRGEFSCAKPSCMRFQNAWVSDRTLCYLASGRPVVVQDTGPSSYLPNGEGMFRVATVCEAAGALEAVNADYERHRRAAREIAETYFNAEQTLAKILNVAL